MKTNSNAEQPTEPPSRKIAPLLSVRGLTKRYATRLAVQGRPGKAPGVSDVSFDVYPGEVVALAGPMGSGKTTVLRCVLQLTRPSAGTVVFEGEDLSRLSRRALRKKRRDLQVVFQDAYGSLDPRMPVQRILEEPLIVHRVGDRATRAALIAKGLEDVGLEASLASRRPAELSVGERQRVAIGRALSLQPRLLLLDEPTSGLDTVLRRQIADLLSRIARRPGCAALLVTHDIELVIALADRVVVISDGRVVQTGKPDEILGSKWTG